MSCPVLKNNLLIGWDVGGWNCDSNPNSRDALCAIEEKERTPAVVGNWWRGNLRATLVKHKGIDLISSMLELVNVDFKEYSHVTFAIDTPLAWPNAMIELVTNGTTQMVPGNPDNNPYLFRAQERALFSTGCRPLSTVRDMIGSQSTKGIYFLNQAGLKNKSVGVWENEESSISVIETYPAVAVRNAKIKNLTMHLFAGLKQKSSKKGWAAACKTDVSDAITCALVGRYHRVYRGQLNLPPMGTQCDEGWIWLPSV